MTSTIIRLGRTIDKEHQQTLFLRIPENRQRSETSSEPRMNINRAIRAMHIVKMTTNTTSPNKCKNYASADKN
jgi:hypothetical protein